MTKAKIIHVLDELGYSVDVWSSFSDIPLLTLLQDINLLIHPENMRLNFNSAVDLIEVSYGVQSPDGLSFTSHFGETEAPYTPDSFIDFAEICGIITSSYRSPYGTYYTKYFKYQIDKT